MPGEENVKYSFDPQAENPKVLKEIDGEVVGVAEEISPDTIVDQPGEGESPYPTMTDDQYREAGVAAFGSEDEHQQWLERQKEEILTIELGPDDLEEEAETLVLLERTIDTGDEAETQLIIDDFISRIDSGRVDVVSDTVDQAIDRRITEFISSEETEKDIPFLSEKDPLYQEIMGSTETAGTAEPPPLPPDATQEEQDFHNYYSQRPTELSLQNMAREIRQLREEIRASKAEGSATARGLGLFKKGLGLAVRLGQGATEKFTSAQAALVDVHQKIMSRVEDYREGKRLEEEAKELDRDSEEVEGQRLELMERRAEREKKLEEAETDLAAVIDIQSRIKKAAAENVRKRAERKAA